MKNRCSQCRKKLGLTPIECRCKKFFCSLHRYPEAHQCVVDYKKIEQPLLKKNLPEVVSKKVEIL